MIPSETFKPEFHVGLGLGSYTLALLTLIIIVIVLAKKYRPLVAQKQDCRLIEKFTLHPKTTVYIVEYQHQRFLLADNQQSIAIQTLPSDSQGSGNE